MYALKCAYCGKTFYAKRSDARYCSSKCCTYSRRKREKKLKVEPGPFSLMPDGVHEEEPKANRALSKNNISVQISKAHGMVSFFDAASVAGPRDTRDACEHIAKGFERTLREIGL